MHSFQIFNPMNLIFAVISMPILMLEVLMLLLVVEAMSPTIERIPTARIWRPLEKCTAKLLHHKSTLYREMRIHRAKIIQPHVQSHIVPQIMHRIVF